MAVTLEDYILLFYIYSILGWCMETVYMTWKDKQLMNRGYLVGPICPIYGCGLVSITYLFQGEKIHPVFIFVSIIILCTILEYSVGCILEKAFHTKWWDYSDMRFNFRGRICVETMLPFGIMGTFALYRINPFFLDHFHMISNDIRSIVLLVAVLLTISDLVFSTYTLSNLSLPNEENEDHTAEISRKVREVLVGYFRK